MNFLKYFFASIIFLVSSAIFAQTKYAIYIDAGSSGSRLHIFQYETTNMAIPLIKDISSINVKPGLSSYASHPEQAGPGLKTLFDYAEQFLQKNNIDSHTIKLNILATAGMRLLPENQQQEIYNQIRAYLNGNYSFQLDKIKTIPGEIEGLYGWLDVNYLLENFQLHRPTVGSIDMGGASTQIAFETDKQSEVLLHLEINKQSYSVFSKSFLGLGQDQARSAMLENKQAAYCYPPQYAYDQTNIGAFNMQSCGEIYQNIIKNKLADTVIPINAQTSFVAFSGIYFNHNFFGVDNIPNQLLFEQCIQSVCNKSWNEIKKEYPTVAEKYLSNYCTDGVYHDRLLYNNYHVNSANLKVTNSLNGTEIDWTLGALLYDLINEHDMQ